MFDLISAIDLHDFGDVDMTVEEVRDDLAGADLANDSWLVLSSAGSRGRGAGRLCRRRAACRRGVPRPVSVHPEWRRRGIGSALARQLEQAVRERLTPDATEPIPILGFVKGDSTPERQWARAWATPGRAASGGCGSTSSHRRRSRSGRRASRSATSCRGRTSAPCTTRRKPPSLITGATCRVPTRTSSSGWSAATSTHRCWHMALDGDGRGHGQ